MAKKAVLVKVSLMTRVIVDDNATEETILELAIPRLSENLMNSPYENLEDIVDDTECPYTVDDDREILEIAQRINDIINKDVYTKLGDYIVNDECEYPQIIIELKEALNNPDKATMIVDYLPIINVWHNVAFAFNVTEFCNLIGLK